MIKYKLKCNTEYCSHNKEFDGWFQNIEAYEKQKNLGLITCPICSSDNVTKMLTTPSLKKIRHKPLHNQSNQNYNKPKIEGEVLGNENIKNLYTILRTVKKEIQKNSTFVGDEFVSKARSMNEGNIKEKPIHGYGTNEEIQELREEGVDVVKIPWISDDH